MFIEDYGLCLLCRGNSYPIYGMDLYSALQNIIYLDEPIYITEKSKEIIKIQIYLYNGLPSSYRFFPVSNFAKVVCNDCQSDYNSIYELEKHIVWYVDHYLKMKELHNVDRF